MPKIEILKTDLENLTGRKVCEDELLNIKCEIDREDEDYLVIEVSDTNRPDLWSVEGIARELRGLYCNERGPPKYKIKKCVGSVNVDKDVIKIRKYIGCAVVKNVALGKEGFEQLIQLQEKIMENYGRKRRKVAIGTSDFDLIKFPVNYIAANPEDYSFVPLHETVEMTLSEILEKTEKGKEYSQIIEHFEKYPLLVDSKGDVISFPPIINSNDIGRIDEHTRNIFVDVTGTSWKAVKIALNVIVSALAERGGEIWFVDIKYPDKRIKTPILESETMEIDINYFNKVSGLCINEKTFKECLEKMRYSLKKIHKQKFIVSPPFYRGDIMHQRDIVEDVLIAIGYNTIEPRDIPYPTEGGPTKEELLKESIRELLVGACFQEVLTFSLTDPEIFRKAGMKAHVRIENPVSSRFSVVRSTIIPSVLEFLAENKKEEYPQRIFEIGEVVNERLETKVNICSAIASSATNYTEIRGVLEFVLDSMGVKYTLRESNTPPFIEGRCASVYIAGNKICTLGEIHPKVLENFGLNVPVSCFEMSMDELLKYV